MNKEELEGKWNQVKGAFKKKYAELFDKDETILDGTLDQVIGKIQDLTGKTKDAIEKDIRDLELEEKWNQVKESFKTKYAELVDKDETILDGTLDQVIGKIQELTGKTKSAIEKEISDLELEEKWNKVKGTFKTKYAELVNDANSLDGTFDEVIGKLQKKLGKTKEAIEKEIRDFKSDK